MDVHLVDGTYELFRHFFAVPPKPDTQGNEIGAVRGVLASLVGMIERGATHIGVATDHVVESFRNELYAGYKTADGVPAPLLAQFPELEESLESMGVVVWPMVRYEADDALASAAAKAALDERVNQVILCSPDKDLAQCVVGSRVVQLDRRRGNRFRITWRWSVTLPTVTQDCRGGARKLRRLPFRGIHTLKTFPRTGGNGIAPSAVPTDYRGCCLTSGATPSSIACWRP